jgi:hypothetical protein
VLAVVRGATDMNLYLDGKDVGGSYTGSGGAIASNSNPGQIGKDVDCGAGTTNFFDGRIDDLRVYNRALSATEVKQLYKLGVNIAHSDTNFLSNGLVGYWTFDGGSIDWHTNTVADMSGNGNTGSLISMSTTSSPVGGKIGQALQFNGSTQYIRVPYTSTLDLGDLTLSLWIKNTNPISGVGLVSRWSDSPDEDYILWEAADEIKFGGTDSAATQWVGGWTALSDGKWHHLVVTRRGNVATIYADAALKVSVTSDGNLAGASAASQAVNICAYKDGAFNSQCPATIDDVRIYNRALSATEIKQLYNAGR